MSTKQLQIRTSRRANAENSINLCKRRLWFADDVPDKTTDDNKNQEAVAPEQDTPPQDAQTGGNENSQERTFTQKQVDALIGERATRAKKVTTQKMLEELGIESVADAKSILEAHKKAQEAEMSEVEKLQKQLDEKTTINDELRRKRSALLTTNAVLTEASKKEHGLSPDIHETLLKLVDMSLLNVDDNGVVTGAKAAIEQAIKDHPVLKTNGSRGSGVGSPVRTTPAALPPDTDKRRGKPQFKL